MVQDAWTANEYVIQDCVDHEVYKMVGRHGVEMVSRGVAAGEAFKKYGIGCKERPQSSWRLPYATGTWSRNMKRISECMPSALGAWCTTRIAWNSSFVLRTVVAHCMLKGTWSPPLDPIYMILRLRLCVVLHDVLDCKCDATCTFL